MTAIAARLSSMMAVPCPGFAALILSRNSGVVPTGMPAAHSTRGTAYPNGAANAVSAVARPTRVQRAFVQPDQRLSSRPQCTQASRVARW
ncbi:hypothetical protein [Actinopolymorpha rutila]|nr:hypothetical protein [Actinopolymorpha rutila]